MGRLLLRRGERIQRVQAQRHIHSVQSARSAKPHRRRGYAVFRRAAARARGEGSRRGQAHRPRKREFFRSVRIGQKEKSQNQKRQENEVKRQTNRKCAERR